MQHPNLLDQQIDNLRTLQQSYDQIAGAAEAYNTGKVQLADNLVFKGVPASVSETLPELAGKVRDIAQTVTEIDGGDMYAAQLFGDGALWNLYDVLADMKTRFMGAGQYACLIVCEYYKGYDSLQLQGADAYYTCDGDFYNVSSTIHVWHDSYSGKANRWVCFLFATDGARLDITNTAISPRSMYIGGHIGTIEYFVNGRLTDIVCGVEETDVVDNFLSGSYAQEFGFNVVIRNVKNIPFNTWAKSNNGTLSVTGVEVLNFKAAGQSLYQAKFSVFHSDCDRIIYGAGSLFFSACPNLVGILLNNAAELGDEDGNGSFIENAPNLRFIYAPALQRCKNLILNTNLAINLNDMTVGAMVTNLKMNTWNPTNVLADADKKAQLIDNIKNHILARVSDATGGTQLVFTISTNMYNAIASETITWNEETMTLADAFLTKNWLLAGA